MKVLVHEHTSHLQAGSNLMLSTSNLDKSIFLVELHCSERGVDMDPVRSRRNRSGLCGMKQA